MKKRAKKLNKVPSPFWNPVKEGQTLEGNFVQFERTQYGGAIRLTTGLVGMSYVLLDLFGSVYQKLHEGAKLKLQFDGLGKGKRGRRTKLFSVWMNGKKLERVSGQRNFGQAIAGKDLKDLFEVPF